MTTQTATTDQLRLDIVVSNGAEINEHGRYCLYLVVWVGDEFDASYVLTDTVSDPAALDIDAATAQVDRDFAGRVPDGAEWRIDPAGRIDLSYSTDGRDDWGHYTVARLAVR